MPAASVPVSVTLLAPKSSQLNADLLSDNVSGQLSVEPPSTSAVVIETKPVVPSATVISFARTVGAISSSTVYVAVAEEEFPSSSVAVTVTVLAPTLVQSKAEVSKENTKSPFAVQLSVEPLSKSDATAVNAPFASNEAVTF